MFTESSSQRSVPFPPPAAHLKAAEKEQLLISTPNGVLCRRRLPLGSVLHAVIVWVCDVICIQSQAPVWSAQNGIQVFHIGIDPFRAASERRETSTLK